MNSFENILSAVRQKRPLVHFITNYVTVNDCANMTLALGGSPIMADDLREVEQIVGHCSALVLNIGTLSERTVQSMLAAGKEANRLGRPVVFDPVGVGASRFRNETAACCSGKSVLTSLRAIFRKSRIWRKGSAQPRGCADLDA